MAKTFGAQANEAGKLEEFQQQRLDQYKTWLDEAVQNKTMTQEQADERLKIMQDRLEACDGTGTGAGNGLRNGTGAGYCGMGQGRTTGTARGGRGFGMGMGRS